jgi:sarcosine oxidase subunit beta
MPDQENTAEMLIIGGGVIGLSIAYHCAEAGIDVTLLERGELGAATTSQTANTVRSYLPRKPHDSELVVRGLADYRAFPETIGVDPGLEDLGFMVVLTSKDQVTTLEAELEAQRAAGVELELITAAQACEHNPWLDPRGIEAAIWTKEAYLLRPDEVVRGYSAAAQKHGARVLTGVNVTGLDARTGQVTTSAGTFTAEVVVIAAGPWSGEVAALTGLKLPVWGQFSELLLTDPLIPDGEIKTPFTLHLVSGLKTKGMGSSFLVGLERISKQQGLRDVWFNAALEEIARRYPRLEEVGLRSGWTGTLDVTSTKSAVIGRASGEHERVFYAAGYTGHGLGQAPVTGQIIRDLYLGRDPGVDLAPFTPVPEAE